MRAVLRYLRGIRQGQEQLRRSGGPVCLSALFYVLATCTQPLGTLRAAVPEEPSSEVNGSATIGRQKIDYKVTTGRLPVTDKTGKAKSNMFFIAYTRKMD